MRIDRPLRVLIFNWRDGAHPNAGGAEMYTHRIAAEWVKMGHSVTLFCSSVKGRAQYDVENGLQIIRRGSKHSVYREAKRFYRIEGRGNFDVVIDEVNTRPFSAPRWVNDIPTIAIIHQVCREVWFYEYSWPVAVLGRFILEPMWLRRYRSVPTITVSRSSAMSLKEYGLKNVTVVAEGMDITQVTAASTNGKDSIFTCIFIGRLAANKRPHDAIKAFQLMLESVPYARMWVIGTGPLEQKLRDSSPPEVEFLGRVSESEKRQRLAEAHVLLVTSVREGWGLVVTEAAQCGTLTVGYNVPGLSDSIPASNGILTDPSPDRLSEALVQVSTKFKDGRAPEVQPNGVMLWRRVAIEILEVMSGIDTEYLDGEKGHVRSDGDKS